MFLRRVFSRKENNNSSEKIVSKMIDEHGDGADGSTVDPILPVSPQRIARKTRLGGDDKRGLSVLQLTPLWEHIIRTKTLPDNINITELFMEFLERFYDPEWQVRQHALRVLVDVLIVMRQESDKYFTPLMKPLVENLGHEAPAVRKAALDVLKVFMSQTARPDSYLLEIIEIGMEQQQQQQVIANDGQQNNLIQGRLCVGVMLSLPSLIHTNLVNVSKRSQILQIAINALTKKMNQIIYQEITLKVLLRIRQMIGSREFSEHIAHGAYREFELLCNVYGLPNSPNLRDSGIDLYVPQSADSNRSWQVLTPRTEQNTIIKRTELHWKSNVDEDDDEDYGKNNDNKDIKNNEQNNEMPGHVDYLNLEKRDMKSDGGREEKVILETEIKIQDTSVMMRILEAQNSHEIDSDDDDDDIDTDEDNTSVYEHTGIVRVLTDSELEEINNQTDDIDDEYLRRTPRRVTFGGEIVKMRTPDTDSVTQSDTDDVKYITEKILGNSIVPFRNSSAPVLRHTDHYNDNSNVAISTAISSTNQSIVTVPVLTSAQITTSLAAVSETEQLNITLASSLPSTSETLSISSTETKTVTMITTPILSIPETTVLPPPPESVTIDKIDSDLLISSVANNLQKSNQQNNSKYRRFSISPPIDDIVTSLPSHRGIEVFHNLQRSPIISPKSRSNSLDNRNNNISDLFLRNNNNNNNNNNNVRTDLDKVTEIISEEQEKSENISEIKTIDSLDLINNGSTMNDIKTWADLNLLDAETIKKFKSGDWRLRLIAVNALEESLRSTENLAIVQPHLESLLRTLLSSEKNPDVSEEKRKILINLISRLPLDNLENRSGQIIIGLCRQGGAGSNRIVKAVLQRLPPTSVVLRLLSDDFLQARSSRFRENALQMILYALMTFPSTYFDIETCVGRATQAANDRKKRVRQASLDVLAVLGQISSPKSVLDIVMHISSENDDYDKLLAAIKARLARKQLPIVSADGNVQYALRIPSPPQSINGNNNHQSSIEEKFDADIEWIIAGIGSVSPTSLQRRAHLLKQPSQYFTNRKQFYDDSRNFRFSSMDQFKTKLPHEILAVGVGVTPSTTLYYGNNNVGQTESFSRFSDDDKNTHYIVTTTIPSQNSSTLNGTINDNNHNGNMRFKSQQSSSSISSSTDSPTEDNVGVSSNSSSSRKFNENFNAINIRPSKLPITSRFPVMESKSEVKNEFSTDNYSHNSLGNNRFYQCCNASSLPKHIQTTNIPIRNGHGNYSQGSPIYHQSPIEENQHRPASYPISNSANSGGGFNNKQKRFINVDKYLQENKTDQQQLNQANGRIKPNDLEIKSYYDEDDEPVLKNGTPIIPIITAPEPYKRPDSTLSDSKSTKTSPILRTTINQIDTSSPTDINNNINKSNENDNNIINDTNNNNNILPDDISQQSVNLVKSSPETQTINNNDDEVIVLDGGEDEVDSPETQNVKTPSTRPQSFSSTIKLDDDNISDNLFNSSNNLTESIPSIISDNPIDPVNASSNENEIVPDIENVNLIVDEENLENLSIGQIEDVLASISIDSTICDDVSATVNMDDNDKNDTEQQQQQETDETIRTPSHSSIILDTTDLISVTSSSNELGSADSHTISQENIDEIDNINNNVIDFIEMDQTMMGSECKILRKKNRPPILLRKHKISPLKQQIIKSSTSRHHHQQQQQHDQQQLFAQNVKQFDRPKEATNLCLNQLENSNWELTMIGLQNFIRLIRYHPQYIETNIHLFIVALGKHIRNLRSQVSRAACQAAGEFFITHTKSIEMEADDLAINLFNRTADTNKFLRYDAVAALESMCDQLHVQKVIQIVTNRGATHQNALVRTASAKLCNRIVSRVGYARIYSLNREYRDKFIIAGANFLMEGSLETRNYAKILFQQLSQHSQYNKIIFEVIPSRTYRNIEKTLKSIGGGGGFSG